MLLGVTYLSALLLWSKADIFLLPCPFKYFLAIDCPGCGFQRSLLALLQGDIVQSFHTYPPTIPFLLSFACGVGMWVLKLNQNAQWLKVLYFFTGSIMVINYLYKVFYGNIY